MAASKLRIAMERCRSAWDKQRLIRSVLANRREGEWLLSSGDRLVPEPILVARSPDKLSAPAGAHGGLQWSADRAAVLAHAT